MWVGTAQLPVGVIGQPDPGQSGRVERPQHAAAVLHADRDVGRHFVEHMAVEWARDRVVVTDGTYPAVVTHRGGGEHPPQRFPPADRPGSDED